VLKQELEGNEAECFKKLPGLVDLIETNDQYNHVHVNTDNGHFQRCFIIPTATRVAFEFCRPFIALDGCHTKSRFWMTPFVACTLDGNNKILPLTWAIVPIEDGDNWLWFLQGIKEYFASIDQVGIVFISDRDKGLRAAVTEVYPELHHSYCC
jgi:hypothetical protein